MNIDESLEKSDRRLLIASLIGVVLVGSALLRDDLLIRLLKTNAEGEVIGRVISKKNDVRRRHNQSLTWYEAFNNEAIKERDSLFTGTDSELTVEISGERQLSLEANTLVVMHTRGNEVLLDLQLGSVASFAKNEQTINVLSEGQVTTIKADKKAAPVLIKKNSKGSLTIFSRTGDVEVGIGNKKVKIKKNETLILDKALTALKKEPVIKPEVAKDFTSEPGKLHGPDKPPPLTKGVLPQPAKPQQKVVLKFKDGVDVRSPASLAKGILNPPVLEWKTIENAREYSLEISNDQKFENPFIYDPLDSTSMVWRGVKPGGYFWRVRARGFHEDETPPGTSAKLIVELPAPQLSLPKLKNEITERIEELEEEKHVQVKWSEIPMAKGYRFMASVDGKTFQNSITKSSTVSFQIPPNKTVEVKVAAVDERNHAVSVFSKDVLEFKRELQIKAPRVRLPTDKATIVAFDKTRMAPLLFSWEKRPDAQEYELQFATDPRFRNVIAEKKAKENQLILKERLSDTETFWRVRSRLDGHFSAWSKPRSYEIKISGQ